MHIFLERVQLLHDGRFSSHLILRCLDDERTQGQQWQADRRAITEIKAWLK